MTFTLKYNTSFPNLCPAGSFPLIQPYSDHWNVYQAGWPDTATQRHYPVGGFYDPASTLSVQQKGSLDVNMFRTGSSPVHSSALYAKAATGVLYGRFVESFSVVRSAPGYKSAHLLWPHSGNQDTTTYEVDYPEGEWDEEFWAYVHAPSRTQQSFGPAGSWGTVHTSWLDWEPGKLTFWLDGKVVGSTRNGVPNIPMDWIIQNESALNGEAAAPGSSVLMQIHQVQVYSYS